MEEPLGYWGRLEAELINSSGDEIRDKIFDTVNFLLENFGTVKQYNERANEISSELDQRLDWLDDMHSLIYSDQEHSEELVKKIFDATINIEGLKDKNKDKAFSAFYINLDKFLAHHPYGVTIDASDGGYGYPQARRRLKTLQMIFELGNPYLDVESVIHKHRENLDRTNSQTSHF